MTSQAYKDSGVDTGMKGLGTWKQMAIAAAQRTQVSWIHHLHCSEEQWSRGESCFVYTDHHSIRGLVTEGLGTFNRVAEDEEVRRHHGRTYYDVMAISNFMMAANDAASVGIRPQTFAMHVALRESDHLNSQNGMDLLEGTIAACLESHTIYGGGETPTLKDIILPGTMELSGTISGYCPYKKWLINSENLQAGARILLVSGNGVHANGITLIRKIADSLPQKYLTKLPDGRTFAEALLLPTPYYGNLIFACQVKGVNFLSASPITGDGWAKIMRAKRPFTYKISTIPVPQLVFDFIRDAGGIITDDLYKTFNMNAGMALFVMPHHVSTVTRNAQKFGLSVIDAGEVIEGPKQVIIEPLDLIIPGDALQVR